MQLAFAVLEPVAETITDYIIMIVYSELNFLAACLLVVGRVHCPNMTGACQPTKKLDSTTNNHASN